MEIYNKKILVLAPHTDDLEFGCGGTVHKLSKKNEIFSAAFSACMQSVRKNFPEDILISEVKKASKILGIKKQNLYLSDFEVRTFNYRRQEILETILDLKKNIDPDIVFIPSLRDLHQDHSTIANEALRAFKFCSLLSYELPWNNLNFNTNAFVTLSQKNIQKKIESIKVYKSQSHKSYSKPEFIMSLALTRGVQINTKYAECFEVLRWKI